MIHELLGMRMATFVDVARVLGVKTNQVYMWHQRRDNNGFPEPVAHGSADNGVRNAPWFDIDEVLDWRATYVPSKGGHHTHRVSQSLVMQAEQRPSRIVSCREVFDWHLITSLNGQHAGERMYIEAQRLVEKVLAEIVDKLPGHQVDTRCLLLEIGIQYQYIPDPPV